MGTRSQTAPRRRNSEPSTEALKLLVQTGLVLARERNLDVALQAALDAGLEISGAEEGVFFFTPLSSHGAPCPLFKLAGEEWGGRPESFPLRGATDEVVEAMFGGGLVRCADILPDAHFGAGTVFAPLTQKERPIRSYMAVPVHSARGALLGGLCYGHPEAHVFVQSMEPLMEALAAQSAVAIENVQLHESLSREARAAGSAKNLTREKEDTERRLRQALDAAQLGTWNWVRETDMLDLDERAAELMHVQAHVLVGRDVLRQRVVAEEDRAMTAANLKEAVESRGLYRAEYRVMGPKGEVRWIAASGIPTFGEDQTKVTGMVGTIQDMTLRRLQEEKLRQTEKLAATGRMAATIAHEINNPLEAVTNLIFLSKTDASVPADVRHLLDTADQELARVGQIAQQTLGFYRDTTRPMLIEIGDLLRGVTVLFQRKLTHKKIDCVVDVEPELRIYGLQGELRQVFSNLIVNAIDASLHGRIVVRGRHCSVNGVKGISVLICDEGTGIPPEVRKQLFAPFFTTKQEVGTGLGLWVTRGIVLKQGGSIQVRSRTGGQSGTVFRVFLPAMSQNLKMDIPSSKFLQ